MFLQICNKQNYIFSLGFILKIFLKYSDHLRNRKQENISLLSSTPKPLFTNGCYYMTSFVSVHKHAKKELGQYPWVQLQFEMQFNPNNLSKTLKLTVIWSVTFSKNSTKSIRLFALDFYEVIVDEAEGS